MTDGAPKRRGRPKGSPNKPKDGAAAAPKAERKARTRASKTVEHDRVDVSQLDDQQQYALHIQHTKKYEEALNRQRAAAAEFKNACKVAKADLGADAIDDIKLELRLRTDEGKASLKRLMESQIRIARWNDMPVGHIDDLFGIDRTPIDDRAFNDGRKAGLAGESCAPPGHLNGPLIQKWTSGWHEGQAVLAKGFKPKAGEEFGAPPKPDLDKEDLVDMWKKRGAEAFAAGENGMVPNDCPDDHREDFLEGWSQASSERAAGQDAARTAALVH